MVLSIIGCYARLSDIGKNAARSAHSGGAVRTASAYGVRSAVDRIVHTAGTLARPATACIALSDECSAKGTYKMHSGNMRN